MKTATTTFLDGVRAEVRNLPLYNAGLSIEYVRAAYHVDEVAKLGSNENPFGASPKVLAAIAAAIPGVALYPDPFCNDLRAVVARRFGVAADRLVFGNGSDDLISVAVETFLSPGDEVLTLAPSYGLHVIFTQAFGARIHAIPLRPDYSFDVQAFLDALTPRTRMIMFSNPSNPVGASMTADDMQRLLAGVPDTTMVFFDEAYYEYGAAQGSYPPFVEMLEKSRVPWIVLRTFSKAYSLAGLRLGYAIASDASFVSLMDRVRGPFNVNRLAQAAAIAALEDTAFVEECLAQTMSERERMRRALVGLGYQPAPSLANFLFFDAHEDASELARRLLPHGVIVKPWREAGYTTHIRVSIGSPRHNDQFLDALRQAAQPR